MTETCHSCYASCSSITDIGRLYYGGRLQSTEAYYKRDLSFKNSDYCPACQAQSGAVALVITKPVNRVTNKA